jgi:CRP-like cAMP-binding protein
MKSAYDTSVKINSSRNIINRNEKIFKRGQLMFIEGETTTEMYIIRSGKVRNFRQEGDTAVELALLGSGSVLGELSLLDHQPRSATGQVVEEVVATVIEERFFRETLAGIPVWLTSMIGLIVKRLRDAMKKNKDDIVRTNVGGVVKVLLLLYQSEGFKKDGFACVDLVRAKELIYGIIGLGSLEAETVFLHLILKDMLLIRKNVTGQEYLVLKNIEIIKLYMNYLRLHQRGGKLAGEDISEKSYELVEIVFSAGEKSGRKLQQPLFSICQSQVELEMERLEKGSRIDNEALEELIEAKVIIRQAGPNCAETGHSTHSKAVLVYNAETLAQIRLLNLWLPVFKEEVTF